MKVFSEYTTIEKNKLISEFMNTNDISYYHDWNSIMPVVLSLQTLGYVITIIQSACKVEIFDPRSGNSGLYEAWAEDPDKMHAMIADCCFMTIEHYKAATKRMNQMKNSVL